MADLVYILVSTFVDFFTSVLVTALTFNNED